MTQEDRDALLIGAFVLALVAILWRFLRNAPGIGPALQSVENMDWLGFGMPAFDFTSPDLGALLTPQTALPVTPLKTGGGACCGICDSKKDDGGVGQNRLTIDWGPPPEALAVSTFIAPSFTVPKLKCAWNAKGYLTRNPGVKAAYQDWVRRSNAGEADVLKWNKKKAAQGYNLLSEADYARYHYDMNGRAEGRDWDC